MGSILGSPEVTRPAHYAYQSMAQGKIRAGETDVGDRNDAVSLIGATDNLFVDFLATLTGNDQGETSEALDQIAEFEQLVGEHVQSLQKSISNLGGGGSKNTPSHRAQEIRNNLVKERNSWRLLGKLFASQMSSEERMVTEADDEAELRSEKIVMEKLFARERDMRQAQAIVDWLEWNAKDEFGDAHQSMDLFGDVLAGWENTLHTLQTNPNGTPNMVKEMDPDAPRRTNKSLHPLDEQDQARLIRGVFLCLRSGLLDLAQDLCVRMGQPWRAATLVGWKLHHDPNFGASGQNQNVKLPIEGNVNRDIWKKTAWVLTEDRKLSSQERAIYSALCGNAQQLLKSECKSWEDVLWALCKALVDVKVETEIRQTVPRTYVDMPQRYWDNLTSLRAVLEAVKNSENTEIRKESTSAHRIIQSLVISEDWEQLHCHLKEWSEHATDIDPHLLRFLTHLVIILRRLGVPPNIEVEENMIIAYIGYLIQAERVQQVAWYTAQLRDDTQVEVYSELLLHVSDIGDRRACITLALEHDLPLNIIRITTVEATLGLEAPNQDPSVQNEISELDDLKMKSIDYLLMAPVDLANALMFANSLTRYFIASHKIKAARQTLNNLLPHLGNETGVDATLAAAYEREFACLEMYVSAKESFGDWFKYLHQAKPLKPEVSRRGESADSFAHQVEQEQREMKYQVEYERWTGTLLIQSREVTRQLLAILHFPQGWLVDEENVDETRGKEIDYLRRTCLMDVVFLLHSVYHSTEQYKEAIALADIVASERDALFSVFTKDDMKTFLQKIRDSAVASLERKSSDPWGY